MKDLTKEDDFILPRVRMVGVMEGDQVVEEYFINQSHVDHPPHYGGENNPYEAIKVIEAWKLDFCLGNVVKYISRAGKKGSELQDLQKAKWYLDRKIEEMKS